ncbi:hypothetical protein SEPCBS57363_004081 [Sporothrix epigloea]|uniref:Uncharacterized protein n=1 Tax=Sporothrix epigloea TaxID=1892477 RepID=A0ABP0DQ37_9PEZI
MINDTSNGIDIQEQSDVRMQADHRHGFQSVVPPTSSKPNGWTVLSASYIIKDAFRLHTLLAIGAGLQAILSAAAPKPWCFLPTAALLVLSPVVTFVQMVRPLLSIHGKWLTHSFLAGVVPGRSTAHLRTKGRLFGGQSASEGASGQGLVVFHFGARFNHPLGVLAPGARTMTKLFRATLSALSEDRTAYGLMGGDLFRGGASTRVSNDTILLVLYFRDVEGLQRFAGSAAHREAFQWLREVTKLGDDGKQKYSHLSAFHETFMVAPGAYESLYINTAPILLGNTFTEISQDDDGEVGEDDRSGENKLPIWHNSLVDADDNRLQTMKARLKQSL